MPSVINRVHQNLYLLSDFIFSSLEWSMVLIVYQSECFKKKNKENKSKSKELHLANNFVRNPKWNFSEKRFPESLLENFFLRFNHKHITTNLTSLTKLWEQFKGKRVWKQHFKTEFNYLNFPSLQIPGKIFGGLSLPKYSRVLHLGKNCFSLWKVIQ